jgi:hypothetical protein
MLTKTNIIFALMLFVATATASMIPSVNLRAIEPEVTTPEELLPETPSVEQFISRLPIMVDCGPPMIMMPDIVNKYGEQPFATMDVNFRTPTGQVLSGKGTITVNAETGSWSYIVGFEDTKAENICFFLSGNNFGPYTGNAQKTNKQDNPAMPKDGEMPGVTKRATNLSN